MEASFGHMLRISCIFVRLLELTLPFFFLNLWFFTCVYFSNSTTCKYGVTFVDFCA